MTSVKRPTHRGRIIGNVIRRLMRPQPLLSEKQCATESRHPHEEVAS
jgi:hypothetical protein